MRGTCTFDLELDGAHRRCLVWAALVASAALTGCITPGDRLLVDLSKKGALLIVSDTDAPAHLKIIATDIAENLNALQENGGVPVPKNPQEFSSEASEQARRQSEQEHETISSIGSGILGFVGSYVPGGLGIIGVLGGVWAFVRKKLADKKSYTVMQGTSDFAAKIPGVVEKLGKVDWKNPETRQNAVALIRSTLKDAHKTAASAAGVYHEIRSDVKAHQAAGRIKPIDGRTLEERANDPADSYGQKT